MRLRNSDYWINAHNPERYEIECYVRKVESIDDDSYDLENFNRAHRHPFEIKTLALRGAMTSTTD
jgi:hypothetical protein